jgi:xanthine dehydrogenase large subunit
MSIKAHARLRSIDLGDVLAAEGVVDVCLAADIPGENNCGPIVHDEQILATDTVEYVGQAIFAVAARTVEQARKAVQLAKIEYDELEPILDPLTAVEKASFVLPSETVTRGDPEAAIRDAPHRLQRRITIGGQDQFYLEGHISMCVPQEDKGLLLYSSTQAPRRECDEPCRKGRGLHLPADGRCFRRQGEPGCNDCMHSSTDDGKDRALLQTAPRP